MATPQTSIEVYDQIDAEATTTGADVDIETLEPFVKEEIKKAQELYPFMKHRTDTDFYIYVTTKQLQKKQTLYQERPTADQFWNAAYEFDPLDLPSPEPTELEKFLFSNRLDLIPLGKMYGGIKLALMPGVGSLPISKIESNITLPPARTDSGAISYPDGHPSEECSSGHQINMVIKPSEDRKLRRFASLGWIMTAVDGSHWDYTGHVLVIDMDRGRQHHPWIVLAHEWPNEEDEGEERDFKIHAEEQVECDDSSAEGVFPGDQNRTPIAKLRHIGKGPETNVPFIKQFGQDFEFTLERKSGDRRVQLSKWGPGLAHVMGWHWDEKTKEEVCFAKNGREYMRYNRATGGYRYPSLNDIPIDGEQSLFGELAAMSTSAGSNFAGSLSLASRLGDIEICEEIPRHRQESSTSGF
ncbi:hypothetical protein OEA41_002852 [Lepraria neglecta]|uniref:Uncharacterized protein n=1 Tax=Lepraria neglecta TaxID=209136 RepID=A0AAE0DIT7_9LECA|nr:hypothetical protein OEA41_002852 [Lepraria neglecta]